MHRQQAPWNNGRINEYNKYLTLQKLFNLINCGITEDFFYKGNLFRLHSSFSTFCINVNPQRERLFGKIFSDGSCRALPITEYSHKLVAYSKSFDFTNTNVFYKMCPTEKAILLHINTQALFGIDVKQTFE